MRLSFRKMHGAGNDFILLDDRGGAFPCGDRLCIRALCERRTGIGSDGLILIQASGKSDFRMRFFNPDGTEADLCGNGARCVARFAHEIGAAPADMSIETAAGNVRARVIGGNVMLDLPAPSGFSMNLELDVAGQKRLCHRVVLGVPHAVTEPADWDTIDVARVGSALRRHPAFAPAGANVDFVRIEPDGTVRIRTFERGVEAETLACGTGIAAAAVILGRLGRVHPPVELECAHGDRLSVNFVLTGAGAERVTLLGPAETVFDGAAEYTMPGPA